MPYTPQQNGVAERFNRTLNEMARCMLVSANLGEYLWVEAINTAVFLRKRSPTRALDDATPFVVFNVSKPFVCDLKTFSSVSIALEFITVGYSDTSKAYRLYYRISHQLIVSRDVYFVEPF